MKKVLQLLLMCSLFFTSIYGDDTILNFPTKVAEDSLFFKAIDIKLMPSSIFGQIHRSAPTLLKRNIYDSADFFHGIGVSDVRSIFSIYHDWENPNGYKRTLLWYDDTRRSSDE